MGKISRIQLRGISRTPSDRLTEDGGCAESLNVQLDNTELAPSFLPEDVTAKMGLPEDLQAERIFIHKTANYENYIVVQEDRIVAYTPQIEDEEPLVIHELINGEVVNDITSVGNTLIISTSANLYYVLYKDRGYTFLGNRVPFLHINFDKEATGEAVGIDYNYFYKYSADTGGSLSTKAWFTKGIYSLGTVTSELVNGALPEEDLWTKENFVFNEEPGAENDLQNIQFYKFKEHILELIKESFLKAKEQGHLSGHLFVRYAIELYDGSLYSSMPILIKDDTLKIDVSQYNYIYTSDAYVDDAPADTTVHLIDRWNNTAKVSVIPYDILFQCIDFQNLDTWKDTIQNINFYISIPSTYIVPEYLKLEDRDYGTEIIVENNNYDREFQHTWSSGKVSYGEMQDFEKFLLEQSSLTYLVKSIPVKDERGLLTDEILSLGEKQKLEIKQDLLDVDILQTQQRLEKDDMKHYVMASDKIDTFNNQVILSQASQLVGYDYSRLNAYDVITKETSGVPKQYSTSYDVTFLLKGPTRDIVVKAGPFGTFYSNTGTSIYNERYFSFQTFPDSRAYKMIVKATRTAYPSMAETVKYGEFEMLPHPYLDCAYFYGGINSELRDNCTQDSAIEYEADNIEGLENKLVISKQDDPFVFPINKRYTFQSKILGVAVVTTALSQGQFGQFPLYVFTEDGIWAMETAADGSFISQKPLSRDVCINPDSITSIDNAVVFVTSKGVMMIQGSQVVNISPNMNGKHYTIENTAQTIIEGQDFFCDLLPAISDDTHFLAFVKEASMVYDYAGQRLIFIKKGETYQYVYKLDTQTWHKTAYDIDLVSPINSYPECLVQGAKEGKTKVYDLSTVLDAVESKTPVKGVIATRPFDLGEPDVFKAITDVRIRGQFPKGAVKFILMGSNDGITFVTLSTLRGRSWKLFRMVILADLAPTERISWVDIMYDTKFTNKLR